VCYVAPHGKGLAPRRVISRSARPPIEQIVIRCELFFQQRTHGSGETNCGRWLIHAQSNHGAQVQVDHAGSQLCDPRAPSSASTRARDASSSRSSSVNSQTALLKSSASALAAPPTSCRPSGGRVKNRVDPTVEAARGMLDSACFTLPTSVPVARAVASTEQIEPFETGENRSAEKDHLVLFRSD